MKQISDEYIVNEAILLKILTVFDCEREVSKEQESVYAVWNVPAE